MQALGEVAVGTSHGGHELNMQDDGKWFLVWVGVWLIALAFLLPALI